VVVVGARVVVVVLVVEVVDVVVDDVVLVVFFGVVVVATDFFGIVVVDFGAAVVGAAVGGTVVGGAVVGGVVVVVGFGSVVVVVVVVGISPKLATTSALGTPSPEMGIVQVDDAGTAEQFGSGLALSRLLTVQPRNSYPAAGVSVIVGDGYRTTPFIPVVVNCQMQLPAAGLAGGLNAVEHGPLAAPEGVSEAVVRDPPPDEVTPTKNS
jgi:hypothetical protein